MGVNTLTAIQRLSWSFQNFPIENIALTTSGGKTSALLPHLVSQALQTVGITLPKIIFIDTGYYPDSTLKMVDHLKKTGFPINTYHPLLPPSEIEKRYPSWPTTNSFEIVKQIIKKEPLHRAFKELKVKLWISGIMSEETKQRHTAQILEYDQGKYLYRFHPILDWTHSQALTYLRQNNLPINQYHFDITKGPNQDLECGIHDFSEN